MGIGRNSPRPQPGLPVGISPPQPKGKQTREMGIKLAQAQAQAGLSIISPPALFFVEVQFS